VAALVPRQAEVGKSGQLVWEFEVEVGAIVEEQQIVVVVDAFLP
jgi:hypothetical protein